MCVASFFSKGEKVDLLASQGPSFVELGDAVVLAPELGHRFLAPGSRVMERRDHVAEALREQPVDRVRVRGDRLGRDHHQCGRVRLVAEQHRNDLADPREAALAGGRPSMAVVDSFRAVEAQGEVKPERVACSMNGSSSRVPFVVSLKWKWP